jgi:polyisoprenoid-binding protein YceI
MKKYLNLIYVAALILLMSFGIQGERFVTSQGVIIFNSDAPFELIQAKSQQLKGAIDSERGTFAFAVSVRSFQGFNSPLQREHFNENYLESDKYPKVTFSGAIEGDVDFKKDGTYQVKSKGTLNLHGVKTERVISSTLRVKNGEIFISSKFVVSLSDHNISVPKIVSGKIAREINVEINSKMVKK